MWGTATVRGEEYTIVRRLNRDQGLTWKSDWEVSGQRFHTDEDVEGFIAHDWSWLERRSMRNPDGEALWEWYSSYSDPHYWLALSCLWDTWTFGASIDRHYGSANAEDRWFVTWSFGPLHFTVTRTWNIKRHERR